METIGRQVGNLVSSNSNNLCSYQIYITFTILVNFSSPMTLVACSLFTQYKLFVLNLCTDHYQVMYSNHPLYTVLPPILGDSPPYLVEALNSPQLSPCLERRQQNPLYSNLIRITRLLCTTPYSLFWSIFLLSCRMQISH